ncbi:hypothetical protein [Kitasatospora viridis]|uniref:Uncharacterized protein n=1 Tax=Kitasatospora viridis TaxID=281105 RepID=A0A561UGR8_9ACTN|nr:hypothetical protein [Kitasatospora viridis]TWF98551.1 hypothetical protein FHX73_112367 [Kitasatospora viridis]
MSKHLARAILEQLPPEWLAPDELAEFDENAATWGEEAPSREGVNGFGFDSVTPEATALAGMLAHAVVDIVIESGLKAWWRQLRRHPERRAPLTLGQLRELRARMIEAIVEMGADEEKAAVFADAALAALLRGGGDEEAA